MNLEMDISVCSGSDPVLKGKVLILRKYSGRALIAVVGVLSLCNNTIAI